MTYSAEQISPTLRKFTATPDRDAEPYRVELPRERVGLVWVPGGVSADETAIAQALNTMAAGAAGPNVVEGRLLAPVGLVLDSRYFTQ